MKGDSNKPADDLVHDVGNQNPIKKVSSAAGSSDTMSYGGVSTASATAPKEAKHRVGVLEMFTLALVGTGAIILYWDMTLGFYTELMLLPLLTIVNVGAFTVVLGAYALLGLIRSRVFRNLLALLVFLGHVLGVPFIIKHVIIPPSLSACAFADDHSLGWRDGGCVYRYKGNMVDVEYQIVEARNTVYDAHYDKAADTVYMVRDVQNHQGEITAREDKITNTTLEDKSVVGKSVMSVRRTQGDARVLLVYVNRELTAPVESSHNIMRGFCYDGHLYVNRDNMPDRFMGFYMPFMYKAGGCPADGDWATLRDSRWF